jgi:hypothetical protein
VTFTFQAQDAAGMSEILTTWSEWCETYLPDEDGNVREAITTPDKKPLKVNSALLKQIARMVVMEVVDGSKGEQKYGLLEWSWVSVVSPSFFFAVSGFVAEVQELAKEHEGNSQAAPGVLLPGVPPDTQDRTRTSSGS